MFDLAQESYSTHEGRDGRVYKYRPVPYCYRAEVNKMVADAARSVIREHYGDQEGAHKAATIKAGEVVITERHNLLHLLLRVCLRGIDGIAVNGEPLKVPLDDEVIGGIKTKCVPREFLDMLLDHEVIAQELADMADVIEGRSTVTEEDKKKSADVHVGQDVRNAEPLQDVSRDLQGQDAGE